MKIGEGGKNYEEKIGKYAAGGRNDNSSFGGLRKQF